MFKNCFQFWSLLVAATLFFCQPVIAQDDLLDLLGDESEEVERVKNAFKSTRVIGSHSLEHVAGGVLDFRIMHRFGSLKGGSYEAFGLDAATIRLGLDYGITDRLTIGIGRSSLYKEVDGFLKYRAVWQSRGVRNIPVSVILVSGMTRNAMKWSDPSRDNFETSRLGFYHQIIVGRKFSDAFSLQIAPVVVHRNLVEKTTDNHDTYHLEVGSRIKLTKRIALTVDYFYGLKDQFDATSGITDPLSLGFDIETGGHVFQLHFTNAPAMTEKTFLTENTGKWSNGDIHFGFNISRVFTLDRKN
ncbi:MAG: DUF5777 family beta-barrel protein [Bacteroidia bacterium]